MPFCYQGGMTSKIIPLAILLLRRIVDDRYPVLVDVVIAVLPVIVAFASDASPTELATALSVGLTGLDRMRQAHRSEPGMTLQRRSAASNTGRSKVCQPKQEVEEV